MKGIVIALVALITLAVIPAPIAAALRQRVIPTAMAIRKKHFPPSHLTKEVPNCFSHVFCTLSPEIGSHTTRLGVMGDNGRPQLIVSPGVRSTPGPTYSSWIPEGFLIIPDGTDEDLFVHPFNTIFNLKQPFAFIFKDLTGVRPKVAGHQAWTLQDITAKYLKKLQISGESIIGRRITFLAIVKPSNMDLNDKMDNRHHAIRSAIDDVHPDILSSTLLTKTTMASDGFVNNLAWIIEEEERAVLVYHLGGSTSGATVISQESGVHETLASVHDPDFGGKDFNQRLVHHLVLVHQKRTSRDISSDDRFMMQLGREVEKAKQRLSSRKSVRIEIKSPSFSSSNSAFESQDIFSEQLTRFQLEDLNKDLFSKTFEAVDQALLEASMTKEAIQDIILSGGSARIPSIQSALKDYFGGDQGSKIYHGWNQPETTALFGAVKLGHSNIHDRDIGICCFENGPLSYGIETTGGVMYRFSDENSDRSIRSSVDFSTAMDHQDRVVIRVFEGQRALTKDNRLLGEMKFSGIPPAPQGVPRIRVSMDSGTCWNEIQLTVLDLATKRIASMAISPRSVYNGQEEIERKKEEAKPFEHMDKAIWEFAEMVGAMTLLDPA